MRVLSSYLLGEAAKELVEELREDEADILQRFEEEKKKNRNVVSEGL